MANTVKKYLDLAGLATFKSQLFDYYLNTDTVTVKYASKADKLATTRTLTFTAGSTTLGSGSFDGSQDVTINLNLPDTGVIDTKVKFTASTEYVTVVEDGIAKIDLSVYATKDEIAKVFEYKGGATGNQLYNWTIDIPTTLKSGHIYTCTEDYTCPAPSTYVFHKDYEYVASVSTNPPTCTWVELGNWIDLSAYRKAADQDIIDNAIRGRLDVIEGEGEGSVKKALADAKDYTDLKVAGLSTSITSTDGAKVNVNIVETAGTLREIHISETDIASAASLSQEISDRTAAISAEASTRSTADTTLQGNIEAEASTRASEDKSVKSTSINYTDLSLNEDLHVISEHEIKKLFGTTTTVSTEAEITTALTNAKDGDTIKINTSMTLTDRVAIANKDVTVEIPEGVTVTSNAGKRAFNVASGAVLEITGGGTLVSTSTESNYDPLIMVRGKGPMGSATGTVIIDNVTLTANDQTVALIQSNGNDKDVNVIIKSGTFNGSFYLPAQGSITIEDGTFTCSTGPIMYFKNGSPLVIKGGTFNTTKTSAYVPNGWGHWENGYVSAPAAIVIEACNYGGMGNPSVYISNATFNHAVPVVAVDYDVFGILVINYNNNKVDMSGVTVPYRLADGMTGHVTVDGTTAPSDGWYLFTNENTVAK